MRFLFSLKQIILIGLTVFLLPCQGQDLPESDTHSDAITVYSDTSGVTDREYIPLETDSSTEDYQTTPATSWQSYRHIFLDLDQDQWKDFGFIPNLLLSGTLTGIFFILLLLPFLLHLILLPFVIIGLLGWYLTRHALRYPMRAEEIQTFRNNCIGCMIISGILVCSDLFLYGSLEFLGYCGLFFLILAGGRWLIFQLNQKSGPDKTYTVSETENKEKNKENTETDKPHKEEEEG